MKTTTALTDVDALRVRARDHIGAGAVTAGYSADRMQVLKLLIDAKSTADEFLVHSNEEQSQADQIAERIVQLGGEPDFSPESLTARSHAE